MYKENRCHQLMTAFVFFRGRDDDYSFQLGGKNDEFGSKSSYKSKPKSQLSKKNNAAYGTDCGRFKRDLYCYRLALG